MDAELADQTARQIEALATASAYLEQARRALAEAQVAMGAAVAYGADLPELAACYDAGRALVDVAQAVGDAKRQAFRVF